MKNFLRKFSKAKGRGIVATLGVLVLLEIIAQNSPLQIFSLGYLYLIAVAFAAASEGYRSGLVSATVSLAYAVYFLASRHIPFDDSNASRFANLLVATYVLPLLIGFLRRQNLLLSRKAAEQELEEINRGKYYSLFTQAPVIIAIVRGPNHVFDLLNPLAARLLGTVPAAGRPAGEVFKNLPLERLIPLLNKVLATGNSEEVKNFPLRMDWEGVGAMETRYFDITLKVLKEKPFDGVMIIAAEVTDQVLMKRRQEQEVSRFETLADAIPHLVWTIGPSGRPDYVNRKWQEFTGLNSEESAAEEKVASLFHPDERDIVIHAWREGLEGGVPFETEYRLRNKFGGYEWFLVRVTPRKDETGEILNWYATGTGIQDKKIHERDLDRSRKELETILAAVTDGVMAHNFRGDVVYANRQVAEMLGFGSVEEFVRDFSSREGSAYEVFDEYDRPVPPDHMPRRRAVSLDRETSEILLKYRFPGGAFRWFLTKSTPIHSLRNELVLVITIFRDVTAERLSEQETRRITARQEFLAQAGEILLSSIDASESLRRIAALAVPRLADWAAIDMLDEREQLQRLVVAHQNPAKARWGFEMHERYPYDPESVHGPAAVMRTGMSEFHPAVSEDLIAALARDAEHLKAAEDARLTSLIVVPLQVLQKTVGTITLATAESGTRFTREDLNLAEELARRASIAIYNSRLFAQARSYADRQHAQAMLLDTFLANAPIAFLLVDDKLRCLRANRMAAALSGRQPEECALCGVYEILPLPVAEKLDSLCRQVIDDGQSVLNEEFSGPSSENSERLRYWSVSCYPVSNLDKSLLGVGIILSELTEKREAEREIYFRAYHDPLTRLPNRKAFEERLLKTLHLAKAGQRQFAVMFLDMDRLKDINDGLGHDIGDEVLREVAGRLKSAVSGDDMVARWGGDEFVVLQPHILGAADSSRLAGRLLAAVQPVVRVRTHSLHITASIGVALFPADGQDMQTLQKNADTALYRAKDAGKNRFEAYSIDMNGKAAEKLVLEHELRQALERQQFELYFQPILDIKTRKVSSVEALLRWNHPRLGILHPKKFLGALEELGLVGTVGAWVASRAAQALRDLHAEGRRLRVAVNISARQFSEDSLVPDLLKGFSAAGIAFDCLEVEITESLAMENLDRTKNKLLDLKAQGVSITVDDFGTGYSSLNYLKRLPIDTLKIDKSFVRNVITDEHDTSIIKAIVSMAESLHLKVIAEGVDTETQLNLLGSLGCQAAQGYYISRPLSMPELKKFLKLGSSS